jgi:hypothetical protein
MEKMSPQPQRSPAIAPLARDADGNFIELPDGAVGWRIRRQTGGRPRLVLDHRKQPMLFPLDYTIADVEDVLAPGSYLLDAVDKDGEPLGVTIAVSIGMPRNGGAEPIEPESENVASAPLVVPTTLPNTTSDVRLVLEANVRATQMAFIHNQRTLETGLRMAETLRDSVQVLASSQADWIKSVSSARGFFRNAAAPMAPVEVKQLTVNTGNGDDDGDEEDGGDECVDGEPSDDGNGGGGGAPHWSDKFMPIVTQVMTQVMPAINAWSSKQYSDARARRAGAPTRNAADQKLEEQQAEEQPAAQDEEQRLAQEQQERFAEIAGAIAAASSPGPGIDIIKLMQLLPQRTSTKIMQLQLALSPDEQVDAMQILKSYRADDLADLINVIDQAGLEQCKGFLRGLILEWRGIQAARRARAKAQPPDGGGTGGAGGPGGVSGAPAAAGGLAGGSGTGGASGLGHASGSGRANGGGEATGVGGAVGPRAARRSPSVGSASGRCER